MSQPGLDFARNKALEPSIVGVSVSYRGVLLRKYFFIYLYDGISSNHFIPDRNPLHGAARNSLSRGEAPTFGGRMSNEHLCWCWSGFKWLIRVKPPECTIKVMRHRSPAFMALQRKLPCLIKLIAGNIWIDVSENSAKSEYFFVSQADRNSTRRQNSLKSISS